MSAGGKEVLLKAVALAMPVYSMNIFKLPVAICEEINSILAKFWWSKGNDKKGMHWFAWKRLATSKANGGLGFRDIENFNLALLGKQAWRILQKSECLMARMLRGRYFHGSNILNATQKKKASFVWRSILQGRNLMRQRLRFIIGDGSLINVWADPWIPLHPPRAPRPKPEVTHSFQVQDLIQQSRNSWNEDLVRELVMEEDVSAILSLKLSPHDKKDLLGWHYTRNGLYSVKSAYWFVNQIQPGQAINPPPGNQELKKAVWRLNTAPKIKHFMWRMISLSLAIGDNLRRRHIPNNSSCRHCCYDTETINHLFFDCLYAQSVWRASGISHVNFFYTTLPFETKLETLLLGPHITQNPQMQQKALWILWRLWKVRNILMFQQKSTHWRVCFSMANNDATEWWTSQHHLHRITPPSTYNPPTNRVDRRSWTPPPMGWVKVNYDGSYQHYNQRSQAGWVIRDENGQFQGAGQAKGVYLSNALEGEFQALIISMQHAWSRGYRKVILEGDNKQIPDLIRGTQLHFGSCN